MPSSDAIHPIVVGNKVFRPFADKRLTEYDLQTAKEELNETPKVVSESICKLRAMLAGEKELTPCTDDSYLLRYLRARKFDCNKAYKLLKDYYTFRKNYPEAFRMPSEVTEALKKGYCSILDYRDSNGALIFFLKLGKWKPEDVSHEDFLAAVNLLNEYSMRDPLSQIHGFVAIWDTRGFSFKQFLHFCSPRGISYLKAVGQDCYAGRVKLVCSIIESSFALKFWSIIKPLLKKKIRERVRIVGPDLKELHKSIDPSILPKEYGGQIPPCDFEKVHQLMLKEEDYFRHDFKFGYH